ncbi:MAG: protein translocase subunit SecF [Acidobacteria bacterium]|nr:protein translocase subunit SecF [Acidobacteriota bacterium]
MQILSKTNINFIKWRWHAIAFSTILIVVGVAQILTQGFKLGVDFSGGTVMVLRFEQPVSEDAIRSALATLPGEKTVQRYGAAADNQVLIRLPQVLEVQEGQTLDDASNAVLDLVRQANLGAFEPDRIGIVGPVIGADLRRKGVLATVFALLGMLVYIGLRFRFSFAAGAIIATFHDVLVTLIFLHWFGYEMSLNTIAALLTMTDLSVNDTIVIFDRVRENSRLMRKDALEPLVNLSVNQTLSRTIITAGTTFLAVLGLYLYGGEALEGFAFTMLVGVISGTYSTVFIAAAIAIVLTKPAPTSGSAARRSKTSS